MSNAYWISTKFATGLIETDDNGIITKTCQIWKKFIGQHKENFKKYVKNEFISKRLNG